MRGFIEAGLHDTGLSFQALIIEGDDTNIGSGPVTVKRTEVDRLLESRHLTELPDGVVPTDASEQPHVVIFVSAPTWRRVRSMPRKIKLPATLPGGHTLFVKRAEEVPQLAREIGDHLFRCAAEVVKQRDWDALLELGNDLACIFPPNRSGTKLLRESAIGRYRTLLYVSLAKREMSPLDTGPFHRHFERIVKPEVFSELGLGNAMGKDHRLMWYQLTMKILNGNGEPDFGAYYDKQHPKA